MDELFGRTLIVGDGDFSFTLAYATKLKDLSDRILVASTLLSQNELFKLHGSAAENIAMSKNLGVTILYEVDATKLELLGKQTYDNIIFNFPHTGGKSNIKENRKLVKQFFESAPAIVNISGYVCVTLARGQGGTPEDHPVRQWHDSWQIVGQAAYSDWILYRVEPFNIANYPQYGSTGFRSMDRNFYTTDSKSYFFKRALIDYLNDHGMEHAQNSMSRIQSAHKSKLQLVEYHPIKIVTSDLIHTCSLATADYDVSSQDYSGLPLTVNTQKPRDTIQLDLGNSNSSHRESEVTSCESLTGNLHFRYTDGETAVRSTLFETDVVQKKLERLLQREDSRSVFIAHGDVYRRMFSNSSRQPRMLNNEMIISNSVQQTVDEINNAQFKSFVVSSIQSVLPKDVCLNEIMLDNDNKPIHYRSVLDISSKIECTYLSRNVYSTAASNQVSTTGKADPKHADAFRDLKLSRIVGYFGTIDKQLTENILSQSDSESSQTKHMVLCFVVDLDSLTLCKYDIPDYRLLCSENTEFLNQFICDDSMKNELSQTYRPISFHPPLWRHDLSFWEKPNESVNECDLIDIIDGQAGDAISHVLLMNEWTDPETDLISKCYRIVYQSLDKPLSHTTAHKLQNAIRLSVERILRVTLR